MFVEEEEEEFLDYDDVVDVVEIVVVLMDDGVMDGKDVVKKGYVGIYSIGFWDFLFKLELLWVIVDCGFEYLSEGEILVKLMELECVRVGELCVNWCELVMRMVCGGVRV